MHVAVVAKKTQPQSVLYAKKSIIVIKPANPSTEVPTNWYAKGILLHAQSPISNF